MLTIQDLDSAVQVFLHPPRHPELGGTCLSLPDWFDQTIAADSAAFRDQQLQLWREITRLTDYDETVNEDAPEIDDLDAIYRPAFYSSGRTDEAGIHLLAMGHILLRSGLGPGARVLECGAGFGQNALAFARLGMKVDTVDINPGFCRAVDRLASHYKVDLTAHHAPFGTNPAGAPGAYDLILFYESFHHCLQFRSVIPKLREMLKPGGRILLAAESVARVPDANIPYPWGIRLHWSNVAVMRIRGWMELGFQESYLVRQFANAGMSWALYDDANAATATIYEFKPWTASLDLATASLTVAEAETWHGAEPTGRWSRERSVLGIPSRDGRIAIDLVNYHGEERHGTVTLGGSSERFQLGAGCRETIELAQSGGEPDQQVVIRCDVAKGTGSDQRSLGIFVERIRPI